MPLVSMCTMNDEGHVVILLKCFVSNELIETFKWILEIFLE